LADFNGSHTVWNTSTGATEMQLELPTYPFALVFSPDGERLAIASAGEPVQLYEVASGRKLFELQTVIGGSQNVAFSRDGQRIATADSDTMVRIYDGRNGELLARHTDFLLEPLAASFTADAKQLVTAGGDKVIVLLDATTGRVVRKSAKLADPVAYLEVSPDGALSAAGLMHADNLLMPAPLIISETASGKNVREWLPPSRVLGGGWTNDGHLLAATGAKQGLTIWRVH
jgi:WD40 repeat protein